MEITEPNRIIETNLFNILSLISCAEDYGYARNILYDGLFGMLNYKVSPEDIENYASTFLSPEMKAQGYTQEDYESSLERLTELAEKYNK